jgi:hypothetical protein
VQQASPSESHPAASQFYPYPVGHVVI